MRISDWSSDVCSSDLVRLIMSSEDVIHSFAVPAFRVKQDVLPARTTELWFKATRAGTYHLFCMEFCGADHSTMGGSVIVMKAADYAQWLSSNAPLRSLAEQGAVVRSEEHTSELQSLMRISYAVFCLKKK